MVTFSLCVEWLNGRSTKTFSTTHKRVKLAVHRAVGRNISSEDYYIIHRGKLVSEEEEIVENDSYYAVLRLLGGKGGFGSMLRALGAQIEKTTNREACRDLSGRRMRDVNNEKKLREWAAKAAEREKEKQERRREKRERMLAPKKFKEEDKEYEVQRQKIAEDLDDAFKQGLRKTVACSSSATASSSIASTASSSTASLRKRKTSPTATEVEPKKARPWLDVNADDESSSGESEDNEESLTQPDMQPNAVEDIATTTANEKEDDKPLEHLDISKEQAGFSSIPDPLQLGQTLDLDLYNSATELSQLGLDVLKAALMARGMKCGGTLKERAERLFSVKGLEADQILPSLLAKPAKKK